MNLSTIYADGVAATIYSRSYNPTQPQKNWVRDLQPGESPDDDFVYKYAAVDNSKPPYVSWHTGVMSKGAAASANIAPADFAQTHPGVEPVLGVVPIPMDQAKIPAGYTLTGTPFGLQLTAEAAPVQTTDSPILDRLLAGVNALLAAAKLPQV